MSLPMVCAVVLIDGLTCYKASCNHYIWVRCICADVMEAITTFPEDILKSSPLTLISLPIGLLKVFSISSKNASFALSNLT